MFKKALIAFLVGAAITTAVMMFAITIGGDSSRNLHISSRSGEDDGQSEFDDHLFSEFKRVRLPLSLDTLLKADSVESELPRLDSVWVEENLQDSSNLLGEYRYDFHALCFFALHDTLSGILVIKSGAAGGLEDHHILYIFRKTRLIASQEIGGEFSEGGQGVETFARIDASGAIYTQDNYWQEHDDPRWSGERRTEKKGQWHLAFDILPDGTIIKK